MQELAEKPVRDLSQEIQELAHHPLEEKVRAIGEILRALIPRGVLTVSAYRQTICGVMGWRKKDFAAAVAQVKRELREAQRGWLTPSEGQAEALMLLEKSSQIKRLHPAMDFIDGVLWYGVPVDEGLLFLSSRRQLIRADELPQHVRVVDVGYTLRRITSEAIKRYLKGEAVCGHVLIERLAQFLRRFVFFRDARTYILVAIWIMGTYVHVLFRYYGYLLLHSPAKRCGKTLLEEIISKLAFNATAHFTNPTTAQLYRGPARDRGVQILDELERLRTNKELFGELSAVLNVGFQRGGTVLRYERVGDRYEERSYEPYAPRVLAGIATTALPDVLEDRSILVPMHRRRSTERIERFNLRALEPEIQGLRDELHIWALCHAEALAQLYEQMEEIPALASLDDRLRDIWEPLIAIGSLSDAERNDGATQFVDLLAGLANDLCQFRAAAEQETPTAGLIQALMDVRMETGDHLTPTQLLEALRKRPGFDWLASTKKLSQLVKSLELIPKPFRFPDKPDSPQRAYHLDSSLLEELHSRYVGVQSPSEEEPVYKPEQVAEQ